MKKNKGIVLILVFVILGCGICGYFFYKNNYKTENLGNTINKSVDGIKEYILNISSYEAEIELEVESNRNKTKYYIKQQFQEPQLFKQVVLEPSNLQGLTTIYDGTTLKIENTKLNLSKIYENYQYISENALCLYDFIQDYKQNTKATCKEEKNQIVMQTKVESSKNKYAVYKTLYIDKHTLKPTKLEIQDINQKKLVYILYKEITINSLNKEDILAFQLGTQQENI